MIFHILTAYFNIQRGDEKGKTVSLWGPKVSGFSNCMYCTYLHEDREAGRQKHRDTQRVSERETQRQRNKELGE